MRVVVKSMEKIVLEIHQKEIEKKGFDYIWDKIRNVYKADDFDVFSIDRDKKTGSLFFVELTRKKQKA